MLYVVNAPAVPANTDFVFVVPGNQRWALHTVCATVSRQVGGLPNRQFQLTIRNGTDTLVVSPAADAGTEPGTCTVTWANCSPLSVASGATGIALGPIPEMTLFPGYTITGAILNSAFNDQWTIATAWFDSPT